MKKDTISIGFWIITGLITVAAAWLLLNPFIQGFITDAIAKKPTL